MQLLSDQRNVSTSGARRVHPNSRTLTLNNFTQPCMCDAPNSAALKNDPDVVHSLCYIADTMLWPSTTSELQPLVDVANTNPIAHLNFRSDVFSFVGLQCGRVIYFQLHAYSSKIWPILAYDVFDHFHNVCLHKASTFSSYASIIYEIRRTTYLRHEGYQRGSSAGLYWSDTYSRHGLILGRSWWAGSTCGGRRG